MFGIDFETAHFVSASVGRYRRDASRAAAEVPNHVFSGDLGEPQRGIDDFPVLISRNRLPFDRRFPEYITLHCSVLADS